MEATARVVVRWYHLGCGTYLAGYLFVLTVGALGTWSERVFSYIYGAIMLAGAVTFARAAAHWQETLRWHDDDD